MISVTWVINGFFFFSDYWHFLMFLSSRYVYFVIKIYDRSYLKNNAQSFFILMQILKVEVHCSNLSSHLTHNFSLTPHNSRHTFSSLSCSTSHQKHLSPNTHDPHFFKNSNGALTYMCVMFPLLTIFLPIKYSSVFLERCIPEFFFFFPSSIHLLIKYRYIFLFGHVNRKR